MWAESHVRCVRLPRGGATGAAPPSLYMLRNGVAHLSFVETSFGTFEVPQLAGVSGLVGPIGPEELVEARAAGEVDDP